MKNDIVTHLMCMAEAERTVTNEVLSLADTLAKYGSKAKAKEAFALALANHYGGAPEEYKGKALMKHSGWTYALLHKACVLAFPVEADKFQKVVEREYRDINDLILIARGTKTVSPKKQG